VWAAAPSPALRLISATLLVSAIRPLAHAVTPPSLTARHAAMGTSVHFWMPAKVVCAFLDLRLSVPQKTSATMLVPATPPLVSAAILSNQTAAPAMTRTIVLAQILVPMAFAKGATQSRAMHQISATLLASVTLRRVLAQIPTNLTAHLVMTATVALKRTLAKPERALETTQWCVLPRINATSLVFVTLALVLAATPLNLTAPRAVTTVPARSMTLAGTVTVALAHLSCVYPVTLVTLQEHVTPPLVFAPIRRNQMVHHVTMAMHAPKLTLVGMAAALAVTLSSAQPRISVTQLVLVTRLPANAATR